MNSSNVCVVPRTSSSGAAVPPQSIPTLTCS
jgi:hypothetical protein